ncbi:YadA-like family protein [Fusobacteria bacterium ZRK30]|nr:YadA-like family protein [Fusobacteria bacterium ZRK30]
MKKKLLLLGALMLLSTGVVADDEDRIRDMKISKNIVNNAGSMWLNGKYQNINPGEDGYLNGKEYREEILNSTLKALDDTYTVIKNNKLQVSKNDLAIQNANLEVQKVDAKIGTVKRELGAKYREVNTKVAKNEEMATLNMINQNDATNGMINAVEEKLGVKVETDANPSETGKKQAAAFEVVAGVVRENRDDISEIKSDFSKHTLEAEKRDKIQDEHIEKLKDADIKFAEADKKFADTDKQLKEKDEHLSRVDETLASNMNDIIKHNNAIADHNSAIYEDSSSYAVRTGSNIKADNNRDRIVTLENARATTEEQTTINTGDIATNKADIAKNTDNIDKVEKDLYVTDDNGEVVVGENGNKTTQLDEFRETSYEAITSMNGDINKNSKRIDGLEKKVDGLESKMNKGLAMAAATSSIVYPHLGRGDVGIGAGMGGYGGSQAIAIGVAMQPTENVRINTNVSTSDTSDTMYGAGVGYKFNIFGS